VSAAALIAIDWGSTHRRIYVLDGDGDVLARRHDARGVTAPGPMDHAADVAAIRGEFQAAHGALPVLAAGMVGSARGWVEVPYLPCPAGLDALAGALHWVEPGGTAIVPGLCRDASGPADVMRGEEVQLLGAVAAGLVPADGLMCQPGTHCKWARLAGGAITDFRTRMTGELFALLRQHSLLGPMMAGAVADGPAFRDGVAAALAGNAAGDLLAALFGVRAAVLCGQRAAADGAAYVSGLLIGSDVAAQGLGPGDTVHLLADASLGALYGAAIGATGARVVAVDSEAAFTAGAAALFSRISAQVPPLLPPHQ
jgi:2-dehydro-3-deoxygalactonokinase